MRWRTVSSALAVGTVLLAAVIATRSQPASTYTLLYSFTGGADGAYPIGGLVQDGAGNLYGTTYGGGASSYNGVVFKLDPSGKETVLHSFTGADGSNPYAGLVRDAAGNFYGTTAWGGTSGSGVVFKLDPAGNETVLHSFTGGADGALPKASLVRDAAGNFYGTTASGGTSGYGVVFKLDSSGNETVLYNFTGPPADGGVSVTGLVRDAAGNLYGSASGGGVSRACRGGCGVVFKLDSADQETVLHNFTGGRDGGAPRAVLVRDAAGNLYGTAVYGGTFGRGVVFVLDSSGKETVLYNFTGDPDGANPYAGLVRDAVGNFYGTTASGGTSLYGVVFRLDSAGKETVLHEFAGRATNDGAAPYAGLVRDAAGNLYGTTHVGGASNTCPDVNGCGAVFKLTP